MAVCRLRGFVSFQFYRMIPEGNPPSPIISISERNPVFPKPAIEALRGHENVAIALIRWIYLARATRRGKNRGASSKQVQGLCLGTCNSWVLETELLGRHIFLRACFFLRFEDRKRAPFFVTNDRIVITRVSISVESSLLQPENPRPVCPIVNSFEHSLRAAEEWKRCITKTKPSPSYTKPKKADKSSLKRAAAFSRCRNVFFSLRQLFGLQSWTFSAAGFFPASANFFLASDGFFPASDGFFPLPPKCIFSAAKVLLCCCKVFFLLLWIFPAAKRHFLLAFFPAAETAFSRCKAFFSCCQTCFFPFRCFFLLRTCVFRALREDKELEKRRVIHWAFGTCKLDSAWTNRWQRRPNIETTVREWKVETCSGGRSDMFQR